MMIVNLQPDEQCMLCGKKGYHYCNGHNYPSTIKQPLGWQCPKCGNVYAPSHAGCDNCNRINVTVTC